MDKLVVSTLIAALSLVLSSTSFATSREYSGQQTGSLAVNRAIPTDIAISNYSNTSVSALIPNSAMHATLYPSEHFHIFNNDFYGDTHLVLQDLYRRTFFDGFVCRYARVSVSGGPYRYNVNLDSSYC